MRPRRPRKVCFLTYSNPTVTHHLPENAIEDSDSDEDFADGCVYDESMPALLLIVKWGGELTTAGIMQAEALGEFGCLFQLTVTISGIQSTVPNPATLQANSSARSTRVFVVEKSTKTNADWDFSVFTPHIVTI